MQQGLLSQPMAAQSGVPAMTGAPSPTPSPMPAQPPQGASGASPEEQQMYDTVVGQTTEYLYGPGLENVKQRLQAGAEDGVEDDVGAVVGQMLAMNYQSAQETQRNIPPKVMAGAAKELTEVVMDMAVQMQLINPQEADKAADEALYVAMATFGRAVPSMPPEEQQAYQQMIQQLEAEERQAYQQMIQQLEAEERQAKGAGQPAVQTQPTMQGGQPAGAMP